MLWKSQEVVDLREIETPIDDIVGLPLPVLAIEHPHQIGFVRSNFHHHFHPRSSPELATDGGVAVRLSRGQALPVWLHDRYHMQFNGPPLPETSSEQFQSTVLACSGFVARQAIDLSGDPRVITMNDDQFDLMSARGEIHTERANKQRQSNYSRSLIGQFFAQYALEQDLGHISEGVISEFLETANDDRRKELGNFLLKEAVEVSVEPLVPIHKDVCKQGLIQPHRPTQLPKVVRKFFPLRRFQDYFDALSVRLAV